MQQTQETWFDPSGRSPGEGNGNSLQCSYLEKFHRQRSLVCYSPWDHKESDTTERLKLTVNDYFKIQPCCSVSSRSLFFRLSSCPLCGCTTVHLHTQQSLGCFYISTTSNKAALNTCVQVFVWTCALFFSWEKKRNKMAGTYGRCVFHFKKLPNYFSEELYHLQPPQLVRGRSSASSHSTHVRVCLWNVSHSVGIEAAHRASISISSITDDP